MVNIKKLVRPHIMELSAYSSARDEYTGKKGIFLDANENPLGSTSRKSYNRYPDPYQKSLKKAIGKLKNISTDKIFLGNGSDEAIDLLVRIFCHPNQDSVIVMPPTFEMYEVAARINQNEVIAVQLTNDYQINLGKVLEEITPNTKIIFICSPNNPTGNSMDRKSILEIVEKFNGIVVIDEAYIDFSRDPGCFDLLETYNHVVVLQTFSKAWGLAGLRLGMAFADKEIIKLLNKVKPPYNVNRATQSLAMKAIKKAEYKDFMVQQLLAERKILNLELSNLNIVERVYPSDSNFLLVRFKDADRVYNHLLKNQVIVRSRSNVVLCDNALRITVGNEKENDALITTLKNYKE
ncbi:MAG: histidinol-phosphate transaminase [Cyclobacteriaceae bacterium]